MLAKELVSNKIAEISLFYDDNSGTELKPEEIIGQLTSTNLVFKIKSDTEAEKKKADKEMADKEMADKEKANKEKAEAADEVQHPPRTVILIGRTGSGKSLLGCVLIGIIVY